MHALSVEPVTAVRIPGSIGDWGLETWNQSLLQRALAPVGEWHLEIRMQAPSVLTADGFHCFQGFPVTGFRRHMAASKAMYVSIFISLYIVKIVSLC